MADRLPHRTGTRTALIASAVLGALVLFAGGGADESTRHPHLTAVRADVGRSAESRTVTFTGTDLDRVAAVYLGAQRLRGLTRLSTGSVTALVDHAPRFAPGTLRFGLLVNGVVVPSGETFRYVATTEVDRQLQYLGANIDRRTAGSGYAYYPGNDCANFVSQTLHARGFPLTASWRPGAAGWISSTRLRADLIASGRAKEYPDTPANRAKVRVGDVIQFDWDRNGDRDHSGVVTRIMRTSDGPIGIFYSAHTDARPPHANNSPSHDLSIERSAVNHRAYYDLRVAGRAYFLRVSGA